MIHGTPSPGAEAASCRTESGPSNRVPRRQLPPPRASLSAVLPAFSPAPAAQGSAGATSESAAASFPGLPPPPQPPCHRHRGRRRSGWPGPDAAPTCGLRRRSRLDHEDSELDEGSPNETLHRKKKKKDLLFRAFKRSPDIRDLKTGHVTGSATLPSPGRPWKLFSRFGVGKAGVGPSLGSHSPPTPFCLHRVCGSSTFCHQMFILSEDPSPLGGWRASRLALPDGGVGWGWGKHTVDGKRRDPGSGRPRRCSGHSLGKSFQL